MCFKVILGYGLVQESIFDQNFSNFLGSGPDRGLYARNETQIKNKVRASGRNFLLDKVYSSCPLQMIQELYDQSYQIFLNISKTYLLGPTRARADLSSQNPYRLEQNIGGWFIGKIPIARSYITTNKPFQTLFVASVSQKLL